jgi:Holliday junction DNA helicase RuvA
VIARLTGRLLSCSPARVLIDVGGVGYDVRIPISTFYKLSREDPSRVSLHIHTHVREDALLLFGFASTDERELFERLIGISGVGPRIALAVLSGIGPDELRAAVVQRDRARLERIPGIGKKTAERILLELRDKLGAPADAEEVGHAEAQAPDAAPGSPEALEADALSALVNLGFAPDVARRAVRRALVSASRSDPPALTDLLKTSLGSLLVR